MSHLRKISPAEIVSLLGPINPRLANSLVKLVRNKKLRSKSGQQDGAGPYLAHYQYGQLLMGRRDPSDAKDYVGGFLPPCEDPANLCSECRTLLKEILNERPLYIVLNHVVEEFLEDAEPPHERWYKRRVAPTRVLKAGEFLGVVEAMNALIDPEYPKGRFKTPIKSAAAGARSIYLTIAVGNKEWKQILQKSTPEPNRITKPEFWTGDWNDWHFLTAASRPALAKSRSSWDVQIIVIPLSWLRSSLYDRGEIASSAKDFVIELLGAAWKQSRGSRSESMRQLTLSEAARGKQENTNADLIAQRLLLVLRGDAPAFRPAVFSEDSFPMKAVWHLLLRDQEIRKRFLPDKTELVENLDKFPAFIEPFHLDRRAGVQSGTFFYYPLTSSEQFGYAGSPRDELDTLDKLNDVLNNIKIRNPELLGSVSWKFFASPEPVQQPRKVTIKFSSAHCSDLINQDFAQQFESARKLGYLPPPNVLSKRPRKGFMRRFIRVSLD